MSALESDIIIVGAGLVGSLSAVALAQCGFRVNLVERESIASADNGEMDGRSLVLSLSSVRILDNLGLWDSIKPKAWPIKKIRVTDKGGFGSLEFKSAEIRQTELGFACPSTTLLSVFRAAVRASDKIALLDRFQYVKCKEESERVSVLLRCSGPSKGEKCLSAKILIGADGQKSTVREYAGISTSRTDYRQSAIVCSLSAEENQPHVAFEHFTREGPLAMIPIGHKRYVSVLCLDSKSELDALAMSVGEYADNLGDRLGSRLGRFYDLGRRFSYPLTAIHAERLVCGHSVLVGDAANRIHPNAAQGLNLGIRDVWFLRRALGSMKNLGTRKALSFYCESRRYDHSKTRALSKTLAAIFRSDNIFLSSARRLVLGTMGVSEGLRRQFLLGATGLSEVSPRYD